jgi:ABC-type multidrug transport system ATPase subunit
MGPSGGGKTSLLNALAGQFPLNKNMELSGAVLVNGLPHSDSRHRQAYVEQEDAFYSMLTAEEVHRGYFFC